jgi:3-oxoacyl-[acyl-carrier protein] reductase
MLDEPVILVTGASRGIGAHLARRLAGRGARVVTCSRSAEAGPDGVLHVAADVSREEDVRDLMRRIQKEYGRLDVAINNAGIASMNPVLLTPAEMVDRILAVNCRGTVLVAREAVKLMQRRRWGRVVNLTSVAVPLRIPGEAVYAASKGAVETFTRVFAREVAPLGVTCNAVGPAPIETDLLRGVGRQRLARLLDQLAIHELGQCEDVAHVIDFLIHPASGCVTGQVIYLGGA